MEQKVGVADHPLIAILGSLFVVIRVYQSIISFSAGQMEKAQIHQHIN